MREKRVRTCGWASDKQRPYRPLGSPDLERRDPRGNQQVRSRGREGARAGRGARGAPADDPPALPAQEKKVPKAREMRRWRHTGIDDLNGAIRDSQSRLKLVSNGKPFVEVLRMQNQLIIPCSQLRSMSSLWAVDIRNSLTNIEDGPGGGGFTRPGSFGQHGGTGGGGGETEASLPDISSLVTAGAPSAAAVSGMLRGGGRGEHRVVEKAMLQLGMKRRERDLLLPTKASRFKQDAAEGAPTLDRREAAKAARELLSKGLDDGVQEHRTTFIALQARLRERLEEALWERSSERLEEYERKSMVLPQRTVGLLSIPAWELAAERSKLQRTLAQLDEHAWWGRLMYQLTSSNAQLTSEQQVVLFIIKETIEKGEPFTQSDLFALLLLLPRDFHNYDDVQKVLQFLREELDVSLTHYKTFLEKQGLPIPNSIKRDLGGAASRWGGGVARKSAKGGIGVGAAQGGD